MMQWNNKLVLYSGFLMIALYLSLGMYIIFYGHGLDYMPDHYRVIFGSILIVYGIFRLSRYKSKMNNTNED